MGNFKNYFPIDTNGKTLNNVLTSLENGTKY